MMMVEVVVAWLGYGGGDGGLGGYLWDDAIIVMGQYIFLQLIDQILNLLHLE